MPVLVKWLNGSVNVPFDGVPIEDEASRLLRRAVLYLDKGWCQGMAMSDDGKSVCAMGALALAGGGTVEPGAAGVCYGSTLIEGNVWRRLNAIAKLLGHAGIMEMNDSCGMTKERVIAVFEDAAGATVKF